MVCGNYLALRIKTLIPCKNRPTLLATRALVRQVVL